MNKALKIIVGIIVVVLVVLAGAWVWYIGSPQYALLQLAKAYTAHDMETAKKYVDIDSMSSAIVDFAVEQTMEQAKATMTPEQLAQFESPEGQAYFESILGNFRTQLAGEMDSMFTGVISGSQEFKYAGEFSFQDLFSGDKLVISRSGDEATLTVNTSDGVTLSFKMAKKDNWQIVGFEDLEEFVEDMGLLNQ